MALCSHIDHGDFFARDCRAGQRSKKENIVGDEDALGRDLRGRSLDVRPGVKRGERFAFMPDSRIERHFVVDEGTRPEQAEGWTQRLSEA